MTPRELELALDGCKQRDAWQALLFRRAMHEKQLTLEKLLGSGSRSKQMDAVQAKADFDELIGQLL